MLSSGHSCLQPSSNTNNSNKDNGFAPTAKSKQTLIPQTSTVHVACATSDRHCEHTQTQTHDAFISNTKTDSDTEKKDILLSIDASEIYWKQLAEQKKHDLDIQLKENKDLCDDLSTARERNERLQVLADQGQQYARIIQAALEQPDLVQDPVEQVETSSA